MDNTQPEEDKTGVYPVASSSVTRRTVAPRSSSLSYDGSAHHSHREVRGAEITEALYQHAENDVENEHGAQGGGDKSKPLKRSIYLARPYDQKKIMATMRRPPPMHEFNGYVFSRESLRPRGLRNYFLPIVNQPRPRMHVQAPFSIVPMEALHRKLKEAPPGLMPLSAVHLTWPLSTKSTVYTLPDIYAYMARFGDIEGVYQVSPNSAVIVFCDLLSARECIKCPALGTPWDQIIAKWWEPKCHNMGYLGGHIRQEERNSIASINGSFLKDELPREEEPPAPTAKPALPT